VEKCACIFHIHHIPVAWQRMEQLPRACLRTCREIFLILIHRILMCVTALCAKRVFASIKTILKMVSRLEAMMANYDNKRGGNALTRGTEPMTGDLHTAD
jgi:hypothetical protein